MIAIIISWVCFIFLPYMKHTQLRMPVVDEKFLPLHPARGIPAH